MPSIDAFRIVRRALASVARAASAASAAPAAPPPPPPAAPSSRDVFVPGLAVDVNAREVLKAGAYDQGRLLGLAAARRGEDAPVLPPMDDAELEAERQRGVAEAWAEGLEEQKAVCFDEGYRAGLGEQPALEGPSDLDTEMHRAQWEAYSNGLAAGRAELAARVPQGSEEAIAFALSPPTNRQNPGGAGGGWAYWCLALVNDAYRQAGSPETTARLSKPTANGAYQAYAAEGLVQTEGVPPRGALVFFDYRDGAGKNWGHIGISLGDGTYAGTSTDGWTTVRPYAEGGDAYLGWALP